MRSPALHVPWLFVMLVGHLSGCGFGSKVTSPGSERAEPSRDVVVARDHPEPTVPEPETEDFSVPDPSPSEPVKASMTFRPASVSAGTTGELLVAIRIARAHYLHAAGDPGGKFAPLGMEVKLPAGIEGVGDWVFPPPEAGRAGTLVYRDSVLLRRPLNVRSTLPPQSLVVTGELRYQACTDELCWPASKMELSAPLLIRPKPR